MATKKVSKSLGVTKRKKTTKRSSPKRQRDLTVGSRYACDVCGLTVVVDELCGCVDFCDIICCGKQMKPAK